LDLAKASSRFSGGTVMSSHRDAQERRRSHAATTTPGAFRALIAMPVLCLVAAACAADRSPLAPAQPTAPAVSGTFRFSGNVVNDAGAPLSAALVRFSFQPTLSSVLTSQASVFTDSAGRYSMALTAQWGGVGPDTSHAFILAQISASGYEDNARYFLPSTDPDSANFQLYPIQTIAAGDSVVITLRSSDPVCLSVEWTCRTVHIATPDSGLLVLSLTDIGAVSQDFAFFAVDTLGFRPPSPDFDENDCCAWSVGGQLSTWVVAGGRYTIRLLTPPNASAQPALLRTCVVRYYHLGTDCQSSLERANDAQSKSSRTIIATTQARKPYRSLREYR
jgi:hypothetical protein